MHVKHLALCPVHHVSLMSVKLFDMKESAGRVYNFVIASFWGWAFFDVIYEKVGLVSGLGEGGVNRLFVGLPDALFYRMFPRGC